ncbi:DegT/DnrJ/EryC1/StrS family aminotransferase [Chitinophaga nivalis]|uniref:DegT/DnrJ/EryC1/StrS aminotransferase family protein n=1 Tax=Chitinophaga nivalis TaxID=2991709 RepID=A0ABT3IQW4_9BACT|nr:DegT/DnrJ/EryC1/StrS aminotransferase family protein [Chitinophaga nivalis]MCW3463972.1 DegT/DnrJ/EryC1/StrS aminotransferase family protein [Chitinophaga nivalis]MCW3486338.1 DegT/DnrJ/EryC1/StrS aminotransferase family protein [Chitinophaga nivalis]
MNTFKIPIYQPSLGEQEKKNVMECLDSTWISSKGKFIAEFEREFAHYLQVGHAASVCNGTVAIHLALVALGIGKGDEVIVPSLTYIASVNAITYTGATPVFVDSLNDCWQIDPADVEKKITANTKAVMAVHLYGHPCDMDAMTAICRKHNIFLIEDCAEALGTQYKGKHVGTFGDVSTFSFFGNKTITTGEGGMVVTNDQTLHDRLVRFKGQGLAKHREYWHDIIGYNYRMTNICAAIGLAQLQRVEDILARKRKVAKTYEAAFEGTGIVFHKEQGDVVHSYWMCSILVTDETERDDLREVLKAKGVETRPLFYPVHTMPMYAARYERHAIAENLGRRGINLPSYPELTQEQLDYITNIILTYYRERHAS